jgi:hypothetical protein
MDPLLERLSGKDHLDVGDASDLLQFLQSQAEPLLSKDHYASPHAAATRTAPAINRSSPLLAGAVHTRPAVPVVGGVISRPHPHHSSDDPSTRGEIMIFHISTCIHATAPVWGVSTTEIDLLSIEFLKCTVHRKVLERI